MRPLIRLIVVTVFSCLPAFLLPAVYAETAAVRPAVWAGRFYPGTKAELIKQIDLFLAETAGDNLKPAVGKTIRAVIMPHAGYIYSGPVAARACALLKGVTCSRVILMGPDHRVGFSNVAVSMVSAYETPLGRVPLNPAARRLQERHADLFYPVPASDRQEHSLEVILPFLQVALSDFSLIPMVMGSRGDFQAVNAQIAGLIDSSTLVVASSDLSHYLPYSEAEKVDHKTIRMILNMDDTGLLLRENAACGVLPICSLIYLAKRFHWQPKLIDYANSGDTAGSRDRVVGYAAIAFYGEDG